MPDFPRSPIEFQHRFPDGAACAAHLAAARWPEGFVLSGLQPYQPVQVVAVLVAAGDGEQPDADHIGQGVAEPVGIALVG